MCGIIAVLRRVSRRQPPAQEHLRALLTEAEAQLAGAPTPEHLASAADSRAVWGAGAALASASTGQDALTKLLDKK